MESNRIYVDYVRSADVQWLCDRVGRMTYYLHDRMGGQGWSAGTAGGRGPAYYCFDSAQDLTMFLLARAPRLISPERTENAHG